MEEKTMIRRIAAAVLALLCIVLLFFPPLVGYAGETREQAKQMQQQLSYYTSMKDLIIQQMTMQYGISASDARAMYNLVTTMMKPDLSLCDLRSSFTTVLRFGDSDVVDMMGGGGFLETGSGIDFKIYTVALNVLFFGTIALSVLAAALYLLNRSKIGGVLLAVFACLCTAAAIFLVIKADGALFPHASTFLLPIVAIASLIVYRRDPNGGSLRQPYHEPAPEAAPAPAEAAFTASPSVFCPNCGAKAKEGATFCENCGTKLR